MIDPRPKSGQMKNKNPAFCNRI